MQPLTVTAPSASASALLGAAMFEARSKARRRVGEQIVVEDAGYQRRLAWTVNRDGSETVKIRRRYLSPTLADHEDLVEQLPPGLVVLGFHNLADKGDWKGVEYMLGPPPPKPEPEQAA